MNIPHSRLISIDFGTKRIGIAQSDPLKMFAQPRCTVSPKEIWQTLDDIAKTEIIEAFVIGMPYELNDEIGESAQKVLTFVEKLRHRFAETPIHLQDERFTSEIAKSHILQNAPKKKARQDKTRVDSAAATIILQDYLDSL